MTHSYKDTLLQENSPILKAMKIIDSSPYQIVLVIKDDGTLAGTITDGDVRRGILNGISPEEPVSKVMHKKPLTVSQSASQTEMLKVMNDHDIRQLPVTNDKGHIINLVLRSTLKDPKAQDDNQYEDIKIVMMLGGKGSRLMPYTKDTPKPMIPVGDKPLLETIVTHFANQGFKNFYFCVNYKAEIIKEHFKNGADFGVNITYIHENEPMGTGGALSLLPDQISAPLIIMNGDILTNSNFAHLIDFHQQTKAMATMCVREYEQQVPYGVIQNEGTKLGSIVEKPTQTYFVNAGIYVINPEVLDYVPQGEYLDMPTLFHKLEEASHESAVFPIREYWLDIGNPQDLEQGRNEYEAVFKTGTD